MTTKADAVARVTHHFAAPAERVFDAWLDPRTAGNWLFATPDGEMVRVEIDARVGGSFCIVERRDGDEVEHRGEYLEIDRPRRLVFAFSAEKDSTDRTRVVVEILPSASGCGSDLTLTHELAPAWSDHVESMEEGWTMVLESLDVMLGDHAA